MMVLPKANQPLPVGDRPSPRQPQEQMQPNLQLVGTGVSPTFYGMPAGGAVTDACGRKEGS